MPLERAALDTSPPLWSGVDFRALSLTGIYITTQIPDGGTHVHKRFPSSTFLTVVGEGRCRSGVGSARTWAGICDGCAHERKRDLFVSRVVVELVHDPVRPNTSLSLSILPARGRGACRVARYSRVSQKSQVIFPRRNGVLCQRGRWKRETMLPTLRKQRAQREETLTGTSL